MNSSPNTAMLACGGAGTSSASSTATAASSGALQLTGMPNTYTMPDHIQPLQQLVASLKSEPGQDAVGAAPHNHVQPDTAYGYAGAYPGAAYLAGANAYALYNNPLQMQMWQAHAYASHYNLGIGQNKKPGSSSRQTYARWQTEILEACFRGNEYVTKKKREELHAATTLSDRQIKIWFQNRRMKKKKEQKRTTECSSGQSPTDSNGRPPPPQAPCMSGNLTVKREAAFTSDATYHEASASLASPKSDDVPDVKDYKLPETLPNSLSYANAGNQKKGRQTYRPEQTRELERVFAESKYVNKQQRSDLRHRVGLSDRQIKIWFQNRRMKEKKEKQQKGTESENGTPVPANPPRNGTVAHSMSSARHSDESLSTGIGELELEPHVPAHGQPSQPPLPPSDIHFPYPHPALYSSIAPYYNYQNFAAYPTSSFSS